MKDTNKLTKSSGNVFKDIGFDAGTAEVLKVKADLSCAIRAHLEKHKLTQAKAAKILGIKQPEVSAICSPTKFDQHTIDYLMAKLVMLENIPAIKQQTKQHVFKMVSVRRQRKVVAV
ncbi:MAG: XRE family transcriptional regulator [Proteobacteria bacterium]|nr:XRE family transcriptional regulator [Pseudomonadota bacterium]